MARKSEPPAISKKSFSCPHCGALADQNWFRVYVSRINNGELPHVASEEGLKRVKEMKKEHRRKEVDDDVIDAFIKIT